MLRIERKHIVNIIKLALGVIIIIILLKKLNFKKVLEILRGIPLFYLAITLFLYVAINFLGMLKIAVLIKPFKKAVSPYRLFKDCSLSWALGLFIPGKIGELSLIYLLKKYKMDMGPSTAIVILDKISALVVLSVMSLMGFFMFLTNTYAVRLLTIFIIIYVLMFFFVFSSYGRNLIKKFILRHRSDRFKGFSKSLFFLIKYNKLKIVYFFVLAVMRWIINAFILYLILIHFKQPASYMQVLFVSSTVTIISFIPITFNGLGLKESSAIALFNMIGVNEAVVLGSFLYLLFVAYLLGIFHILISIKRIKEIK